MRLAPPVLVNNGTGRVQKTRGRKATATTFNAAVLEKAIKAAQDGETDSSSHLTRTPTSESNIASNASSASSTPRLPPLQKDAESIIPAISAPNSRPATSQGTTSSCCKPKPVQAQAGSCCSNKAAPPIQPTPPKKSCCGGSAPAQPAQSQMPQPHLPSDYPQHLPNFPQYPAQFQHSPYGMPHPGNNFMQTPPPFNFNTPIYNHMASGYQPPVSLPMTTLNGHVAHHNPEHNCHCGDTCSCFGCAAHPNNATMIEYVRSMHQFMSTGQFGAMPPPNYDMPSYPHQPGYGAEANIAFNPIQANYPTSQMGFQPSMNTMHMQHPPMNLPGPWPQTPTPGSIHNPQTTATALLENNNTSSSAPTAQSKESSLPLKVEEQIHSPTFTDSPSEGKEEDTVTLSPSTFLWQEMVLPGCNDATGTCQCGDGCECVGCLTHGGHNGVILEMMESNDQDGFPDLATPTDANSSTHFAEFTTAPT
ncbi:uncharacterized protein N0V89_006979 [Didymosphaeria variabile]|uniref:Copper-fist domain-containing protein n=1 Tax=Didymosphaeria variabile TaxID=1932322 RepID=A0A9W8XJZ7_9PLEO|nr:uncharacterized protein N0V89_006979 [Didymosphaeria variabile]KAJ4351636.1 hypothetical protein N0V89_006979 [Didymosphaeria variabile]